MNIKRDGWKICRAKHGGYFRLIRIGPLLEILMKHDAIIKVLPLPGTYYLQHEPLFAINKDLDEDTENKIRAEFVTYHGEVVSENAVYGFRQLREIAVKALSPGINDPGVAILCIEHLSDLLSLQTGKRDEYCIADGDMNPRILTSEFDFKALLELSLVPVKTYGKRDYIVLGMLLHAAYQLSLADISTQIKAALEEFALSVLLEADENIHSILEREVVNDRVLELNSTGCFSLALLKTGRHAQP